MQPDITVGWAMPTLQGQDADYDGFIHHSAEYFSIYHNGPLAF